MKNLMILVFASASLMASIWMAVVAPGAHSLA